MKKTRFVIAVVVAVCAIAAAVMLLYELDARTIPALVRETEKASVTPTELVTPAPPVPVVSEVAKPVASQKPSQTPTLSTPASQPGQTKSGTLTLCGKTFPLLKGIDEETLGCGIGWMETSAAPGEPGVCIVMGHRDAEFRILRSVEKGDLVTITDDFGEEHIYSVVSGEIIESADDLRFEETDEATLALVTCYPFYYKGEAPHRYLVTAVVP